VQSVCCTDCRSWTYPGGNKFLSIEFQISRFELEGGGEDVEVAVVEEEKVDELVGGAGVGVLDGGGSVEEEVEEVDVEELEEGGEAEEGGLGVLDGG